METPRFNQETRVFKVAQPAFKEKKVVAPAVVEQNSKFASVMQQRKSKAQVKVLRETYKDVEHLEITDRMREESIRKTGLRWDQIYKWLYDRRRLLKLPAPVIVREASYPAARNAVQHQNSFKSLRKGQ